MPDINLCPQCGSEIPVDFPEGSCPRCLMQQMLHSQALGPSHPGEPGATIDLTSKSQTSSAFDKLIAAVGPVSRLLLRDTDTSPDSLIRPNSEEMPAAGDPPGRLQLLGEIARGGMGAILKGRDPDLGRDVAVKVLLEAHRDKPEMVRRFVEEAQIAGQLQHPGIVPIYELGAFTDQRPYFAMKLVKGRTLANVLTEKPSLTRLLTIFEAVCQTMAYAHARGVIHRDLKPSNIMVGSFGEVQVMDWGLAKVMPHGGITDDASAGRKTEHETIIATARSDSDSDLSKAGSIMGTPSYMAPEQARGEIDRLDARADVFALGSILCELLTGDPAFTGRSAEVIQRKAARGDLNEALRRIEASHADQELLAMTKQCLQPEPEDRPLHAGEVAALINAYQNGVQERLRTAEIARAEEAARAAEATKRATVERDRLRLTMALAAAILGLVVLGGGGWAFLARQKANRLAATEREVTKVLDEAILLRGQAKAAPVGDISKWVEATTAAKQARSLLASGEPSIILQGRLDELAIVLEQERADAEEKAIELDRDRKFLERLETIRFRNVEDPDYERADGEYAKAFQQFGIDVDKLDPTEAGTLLRRRSAPLDLALFLDDWTLIRYIAREKQDRAPWKHLIAVTQATDLDVWRNALRSQIGEGKQEAVRKLAADQTALASQPARSLFLLAEVLELGREDEGRFGRLKESLQILKQAWQRSPNDVQICRELGRSCDKVVDKTRFSTAAVALKPNSPNAREDLAQSFIPDIMGLRTFYVIYSGDSAPDFGAPNFKTPRWGLTNKDGVTIKYGPIWGFDPEEVDAERFIESVSEFRVAIRLAPDIALFHSELADVLMFQGEIDQAVAEYHRATQLEPENPAHRRAPYHRLYLRGKLDLAIAELRQQMATGYFNDAESNNLLGIMYHEQGKHDLAFAAFRAALLKSGGDPGIAEFGMEATGKPAEVLAAYRDAIKIGPKSAELHRALADYLRHQGKNDEAAVEYDKEISILREQLGPKGDDPRTLFKIGKALYSGGRTTEAIAEFRKAVAKGPDRAEISNDIASRISTCADMKYRDGKAAVEFATKACELTEWKTPAYLDTLAAAHAESGDFASAVKWQTKAIELLSDEKEKNDYRTRLKRYQEKVPSRRPKS